MLLVDIHQTAHIIRAVAIIEGLRRSGTSYTIIAFKKNLIRKSSVILSFVFDNFLVEIRVNFVASPALHVVFAIINHA